MNLFRNKHTPLLNTHPTHRNGTLLRRVHTRPVNHHLDTIVRRRNRYSSSIPALLRFALRSMTEGQLSEQSNVNSVGDGGVNVVCRSWIETTTLCFRNHPHPDLSTEHKSSCVSMSAGIVTLRPVVGLESTRLFFITKSSACCRLSSERVLAVGP